MDTNSQTLRLLANGSTVAEALQRILTAAQEQAAALADVDREVADRLAGRQPIQCRP